MNPIKDTTNTAAHSKYVSAFECSIEDIMRHGLRPAFLGLPIAYEEYDIADPSPTRENMLVYMTAAGLSQTMLDLSLFLSTPANGAPVSDKKECVGRLDVHVDGLLERTEPRQLPILKIVKEFVDVAFDVRGLSHDDCLELIMDNAVIGSEYLLDEAIKQTAKVSREAILKAVYTTNSTQ